MTISPQIITLTTDFGLTDEFAGVMKGVILSYAPAATLIDISHSIPPQDIREGACTLFASYHYFPVGTVHLIVIDPGVGTSRKLLGLQADNHFFVGPDNGVFTQLLQKGLVQQAYTLDNRDLFLADISTTFHGRDIMAPVAAHICLGMELHHVGSSIDPAKCCQIELPAAKHDGNRILGTIIHIDHFGNLRTSITATDLAAMHNKTELSIQCGKHSIDGLNSSYTAVPVDHLLAIFDSRKHLEIAVNNGNAAKILQCSVGDGVLITYHS
ncbi:MAG: SAM-dependent chlorinase/fluorinase [Proteobacteria bacterium]|nr:SAM-dependent chlorinase/fluorinase [Pseudomonadota bacterium]MBU1233398.1 SAM-dependent chlorinase/fluorinase [Pseudomonadota bacterium]MBU1417273.1 SAM-dependent chlorinase/fluorinase [Pseudomonadota bacterium]MBU1453984.1 SAM-dependent chlorinase/fluorinase [Pseudomonadota bacterium]